MTGLLICLGHKIVVVVRGGHKVGSYYTCMVSEVCMYIQQKDNLSSGKMGGTCNQLIQEKKCTTISMIVYNLTYTSVL